MVEKVEIYEEAERSDREGALWRETFEHETRLPDVALLTAEISERAIAMIVEFEVTGQALYERKYRQPIWPGGQSGVTIGIGYDVGHTNRARFRKDWQGVIPDQMIAALERAVGVKGPTAAGLAADLRDKVDVPWSAALQVFIEHTLPFWVNVVLHALPESGTLKPDAFGALVSLTYNRGASYSKEGERYREMRAVKAHLASHRPDLVANDIRAMKRIWPDVPGLQRRREREAALFEAGLHRVLRRAEATPHFEALSELRRTFQDTLAALAGAPSGLQERRFFPNGIGEVEIEIKAFEKSGATLRVSAKGASSIFREAPRQQTSDVSLGVNVPPGVAALLNPLLSHEVVGRAVIDDVTYLLLDQFDDDAGGQLLIEIAPDEEPRLVLADTVLFAPGTDFLHTSLGQRLATAFDTSERFHVDHDIRDAEVDTRLTNISDCVFEQTLACVGVLSSKSVPGTNGGRLACAWAVNEIVKRATGRPIGGGLSTIKMAKVLRASATQVRQEEAEPGTVIISPTTGGVVGHVGIVGDSAEDGDKLVYSNSSSRALFVQNFTIQRWRARYERSLGLQVLFYRLPDQADTP